MFPGLCEEFTDSIGRFRHTLHGLKVFSLFHFFGGGLANRVGDPEPLVWCHALHVLLNFNVFEESEE